jgi:hypothetical protein
MQPWTTVEGIEVRNLHCYQFVDNLALKKTIVGPEALTSVYKTSPPLRIENFAKVSCVEWSKILVFSSVQVPHWAALLPLHAYPPRSHGQLVGQAFH